MKIPLFLAALALAGCNGPINSPYEAQQSACVTEAGTREEADACRCRVKAHFGNPCDDAAAAPDAGSDR